MAPSPILDYTIGDLNNSMNGILKGTKIESIKDTINNYAIASAVACMASGVLPGVAGVAAALAQAGFVWATYVKINQTLGISMSENTVKFIGNAILTNLIATGGAYLVAFAAAFVLSWIPFASAIGGLINAALAYMVVYASAIIYLKLITLSVQPDGTIKLTATESTKDIIEDLIKQSNMEGVFREGRNSFKKAKADGSLDRARKSPKCPRCHTSIKSGQHYCSECGMKLA